MSRAKTGCDIPLKIVKSGITGGKTSCVAEYSQEFVDRAMFGVPTVSSSLRFDGSQTNQTIYPYKWFPSSDTQEPEYRGALHSYYGGGYVVDIPLNRSKAFDQVNEMRYGRVKGSKNLATKDTNLDEIVPNSMFVDPEVTRALFASFGMYHLGLNLHMTCQFVFEWHPGGQMVPSIQFTGTRLFFPFTVHRVIEVVLNVLLNLGIGYYWVQLLMDFRAGLTKLTPWHVFDTASMTLFTFFTLSSVRSIIFDYPGRDLITAINSKSQAYYSLLPHMDAARQGQQFVGANMVLCAIRGLRYLQVFDSLRVILRAITNTAADVANFLVMLLIMVFAFAMGGFFIFGPHISGFETIGDCIMTMIFAFDGQLKLVDLQNAFEGSGEMVIVFLYFALIMLVCYLLLLNSMMLGIFLESWTHVYEKVVRESARVEEKAKRLPTWKANLYAAGKFLRLGPSHWKHTFLEALAIKQEDRRNYEKLLGALMEWHERPSKRRLQFISIFQLKNEVMKTASYDHADEVFRLLILKWKSSAHQPNFFSMIERDEALNALMIRRQNILYQNANVSTFEERERGIPVAEMSIISTEKSLQSLLALKKKRAERIQQLEGEVFKSRKHLFTKLQSVENRLQEYAAKVSM